MAEFGLTKNKIFPHKWAFTLLIPFRNVFLSPKQVIDRLSLKDDFSVLEVGPGPGYFSAKVANTLKNGQLVIADIQPEMLQKAKKRLEKRGLNNVDYYLCNGKSFDFKDEVYDRIFMVAVLGEVENKDEYMSEFYRLLKTGGILSISELAGDANKMTSESLKEYAVASRFKLSQQFENKGSYTLNFIKQ